MDENVINILIADDTQIGLEGLRAMLKTANDIRLVGETDSIFSIPKLIREHSPDLLIMDLKWDTNESIGWIKIREIKDKYPELKVIAVTAYEALIPNAHKAGADEVLTKNFTIDELIGIIHDLVSNQSFSKSNNIDIKFLEVLTPKELEVLNLLKKGLSDKEITSVLSIKLNTVKNHVKSILQKLGVENRRKAVIKAEEQHII